MIKDFSFLKDRGQITLSEYKEIASNIQFLEINEFQNAIEFGQEPEKFYMLINGIVSIQIQNTQIKKWEF